MRVPIGLRSHRTLRKLLVPAAALALVAGGAAASANASPAGHSMHYATCHGGNVSGVYHNLRVTGPCQVPAGATLVVNGMTVVTGKHAVLLSEFQPAFVTLNGDVAVRNGGMLAVGTLNEGTGCAPASTATSMINGNVTAHRALSVKINCTTVNGSVTSIGGGKRGFASDCEANDPNALNLPIKDNMINGDVTIRHWRGCWLGYIRNITAGTVLLTSNHPADVDAMEVVTNTINGDLACWGNTPKPQIGDSQGTTNLVSGKKMGQCRHL